MKKITLLTLTIAAFAVLVLAQSTNAPSGQFTINVNANPNLNASYLRVTGGDLDVDDALAKWVLNLRWEAWKTNSSGSRIIDKGTVKLSMAVLKTALNAENPKNALKAAILNDALLTEQ